MLLLLASYCLQEGSGERKDIFLHTAAILNKAAIPENYISLFMQSASALTPKDVKSALKDQIQRKTDFNHLT